MNIRPLLLLFALVLAACGTVTPGYTVVAVDLTDRNEDTRYTVITGGRYWFGPNTNYHLFPTTEVRAVWTQDATEGSPNDESITFNGKDGQPVNADVAVSFRLDEDPLKVVSMIHTFGLDLNRTIDGHVRDTVRDAFNRCADDMTVEDIYGSRKTDLLDCVNTHVKAVYEGQGLNISRVTLNSAIRLPPAIRSAMEAAIAASQRAEQARREIEATRAEGEKSVADAEARARVLTATAEAEAASNRKVAESLTPSLLRLREIEARAAAIQKWDGKMPTSVMGGDVPFIMDAR